MHHIYDFYSYYKKCPSCYLNQKTINSILNKLDEKQLTWVYTDYLKNYYAQKSYNSSYSNCIVFLILQILLLKPKVVITFGSKVLNLFKEILSPPAKNKIKGVEEEHGKCYKTCIDLNILNKSSNTSNQSSTFSQTSISLLNEYKEKFNLPEKHCFYWIISMFPSEKNTHFTEEKEDVLFKKIEKITQCLKLEKSEQIEECLQKECKSIN